VLKEINEATNDKGGRQPSILQERRWENAVL